MHSRIDFNISEVFDKVNSSRGGSSANEKRFVLNDKTLNFNGLIDEMKTKLFSLKKQNGQEHDGR